ncbi:hypothetical protein LEN26_011481 [Aphanomyces euteiches]|nr:hypothetical protein LEN26_011481 [Aphanomyces euteiches]KAH9124752.1 hypothetical protein AeMF1_004538 [Aphanomyces euteiches]KAH9185466.1 hypothetical protein AeNC1_012562 [Aphanomyces euteiches]
MRIVVLFLVLALSVLVWGRVLTGKYERRWKRKGSQVGEIIGGGVGNAVGTAASAAFGTVTGGDLGTRTGRSGLAAGARISGEYLGGHYGGKTGGFAGRQVRQVEQNRQAGLSDRQEKEKRRGPQAHDPPSIHSLALLERSPFVAKPPATKKPRAFGRLANKFKKSAAPTASSKATATERPA